MDIKQNDMEYIQDQLHRGLITLDQANVLKVRMQRVEVVTGSIPREVRKALNIAVKNGELGHMKKDGLTPEVYYHPDFEYLAKEERYNITQEKINSLRKIYI